jgi:hypothetical protein
MSIRALIIASAMCCGAAFAAPNDTAKAPADTDASKPAVQKSSAKHHKKMAKKHQAKHHAMRHHDRQPMASAPQTNVDDQGRQARMDEALAKYRQQRS